MRVPVITGDEAYFVGRVDLLHLNCWPNSESFGVRCRFRIPVIHEQLCVLHRALVVVRMVLRVGHVCRMDKTKNSHRDLVWKPLKNYPLWWKWSRNLILEKSKEHKLWGLWWNVLTKDNVQGLVFILIVIDWNSGPSTMTRNFCSFLLKYSPLTSKQTDCRLRTILRGG